MPGLGPGVGEQDEDPVEAGVGQARHQVARIAVMDPDIGQGLFVDVAHRAGDAVQERLGAEDQGVRMARGLGGHVLPAAEADLQPDLRRVRLEGPRIEGPRRRPQGRQQGLHERGLARLDRPRLQAAVGAQEGMGVRHRTPIAVIPAAAKRRAGTHSHQVRRTAIDRSRQWVPDRRCAPSGITSRGYRP